MQPPQRIDLEDNDLAAATMQTVDRIRPHVRSIAALVGLLFAGLALHEPAYLDLWKRLLADSTDPEVRRNVPITQPLLWLRE
jgi:hypothetical protein